MSANATVRNLSANFANNADSKFSAFCERLRHTKAFRSHHRDIRVPASLKHLEAGAETSPTGKHLASRMLILPVPWCQHCVTKPAHLRLLLLLFFFKGRPGRAFLAKVPRTHLGFLLAFFFLHSIYFSRTVKPKFEVPTPTMCIPLRDDCPTFQVLSEPTSTRINCIFLNVCVCVCLFYGRIPAAGTVLQ